LTLQQRKDFLHVYTISLLEILAAAALTVELWYGAVFLAHLLAAIWTLLLYHLRNEAEEAGAVLHTARGPVDHARTPGPITGRFFWTTNAGAGTVRGGRHQSCRPGSVGRGATGPPPRDSCRSPRYDGPVRRAFCGVDQGLLLVRVGGRDG